MKNNFKRGDICLVDFGKPTNNSSVQAGVRPAVIVQNDIGNKYSTCTIVCPLTSKAKKYIPTHVSISKDNGVSKDSIALCEQIQVIDKNKIIKNLGKIENQKIIDEINQKLINSLGLTTL